MIFVLETTAPVYSNTEMQNKALTVDLHVTFFVYLRNVKAMVQVSFDMLL